MALAGSTKTTWTGRETFQFTFENIRKVKKVLSFVAITRVIQSVNNNDKTSNNNDINYSIINYDYFEQL